MNETTPEPREGSEPRTSSLMWRQCVCGEWYWGAPQDAETVARSEASHPSVPGLREALDWLIDHSAPEGFTRCPLCGDIERAEDIVGGVCLTCADAIAFAQNARGLREALTERLKEAIRKSAMLRTEAVVIPAPYARDLLTHLTATEGLERLRAVEAAAQDWADLTHDYDLNDRGQAIMSRLRAALSTTPPAPGASDE